MAIKLPKYSDLQSQKGIKSYANTYSIIDEKARVDAERDIQIMPPINNTTLSGQSIISNIQKTPTKIKLPTLAQRAQAHTPRVKQSPQMKQMDVIINRKAKEQADSRLERSVAEAQSNIGSLYNRTQTQQPTRFTEDSYNRELNNYNTNLYNAYSNYLKDTKIDKDTLLSERDKARKEAETYAEIMSSGNKVSNRAKTYENFYNAYAKANAYDNYYKVNYEDDYVKELKGTVYADKKKALAKELEELTKTQGVGKENNPKNATRIKEIMAELNSTQAYIQDPAVYNFRDTELAGAFEKETRADSNFNNVIDRAKGTKGYTDTFVKATAGMDFSSRAYLTDDEKDTITYLGETNGIEEAKRYVKSIERTVNARMGEAEKATSQAEAKVKPWATALETIARTPIAISQSAEANINQVIQNIRTGEMRSVDPNTESFKEQRDLYNKQQELSAIAYDKTLEKTGNETLAKIAGFGTNVGLSLGNQAWHLLLPNKGGLLMIASSAASTSMYEGALDERTAETALGVGIVTGAIEYLTEKIALDSLLEKFGGGSLVSNFKKPVTNHIMTGLKAMGVQGLTEAFEESVSFLAGEALDNMVYGNTSDFNKYKRYLMEEQGLDEKTAIKKALIEHTLYNLGMSSLGGFISGGLLGGVSGTYGSTLAGDRGVQGLQSNVIAQKQGLQTDVTRLDPAVAKLNIDGQLSFTDNVTNQEYIARADKLFKDYGIKNVKADLKNTTLSDGSVVTALFNPTDSTIHINNNITDKQAISNKLAHEGFHVAELADKTLVSDMLSIIQENGTDIDSRITNAQTVYTKALTEIYQNQGMTAEQARKQARDVVTDDYIRSEIAADYMSELLNNTDIIAEIEKTRPNFIQRIQNWIKDVIAKLTGKTDERLLKQYQKMSDTLRNLSATGAETAQRKGDMILPTYAELQARQKVGEQSTILQTEYNTELQTETKPISDNEKKISKVRTNTFESIFSEAELTNAKMEEGLYGYSVKTEKASISEAQARLNADFDGEVELLTNKELWTGADNDTAFGIMAVYTTEARQTGDYKKMRDWTILMQTRGTAGGQFVQSYAKYNRTPEGILVKATQTVNDNSDITDADKNRITGILAEQATVLNGIRDGDVNSLIDIIIKQAEIRKTKVSKLILNNLKGETDFQYLYNFALKQYENIATDFIKTSFGKKLSTYQAISHLWNLRTTNRNLVSNQTFDIIDGLFSNNIAIVPDAIMGFFSGKREVGLQKSWASKAKREGAKQGARRSALEVSLDVDVGKASKYGTSRRTFKAKDSKVLTNVEKSMGYTLQVTDEFHKGSVRAEVLESLMPLVDKNYMTLKQAQDFAQNEALYRSFQDNTLVGTLLAGIKDNLNLLGIGDSGKRIRGKVVHEFGLGDLINKYTTVPGSLITKGLEFSPLGYLRSFALMADVVKNGGLKNADIGAQRNIALAIGRATTGSGILALFYTLAKTGLMRWTGMEDDPDARALQATEGISGTQINLSAIIRILGGKTGEWQKGDTLVDMAFLEPFDTLMTIGAMLSANGETPNAGKVIETTIYGTIDALTDTPTLQVINQIYNTFRYNDEDSDFNLPTELAITFAKSSITGFVPSFLRQAAQATDPFYRDTYTSSNPLKQLKDSVLQTIPVARQTLPTKLTNYGEDKAYTNSWTNAINALASPGYINIYQETEASKELMNIRNQTENSIIIPDRNAPHTVRVGDISYKLSDDDRRIYQKTRGILTQATIDSVISTSTYKNATLEEKETLLNDARLFANDIAKREYCENNGIEYKNSAWNKTIVAMEDGVNFATFRIFETQTSGMRIAETKDYLRNAKMSDKEKAIIYDSLSNNDLYDKFTEIEMDEINAYKIADEISRNEYTKYADKSSVIANSPLPNDGKMLALKTIMTEGQYEKTVEAYNSDIPIKEYVDYLKATSEFKTKKVGLREVTRQDQIIDYINKMSLTPIQKSILYLQEYTESGLKDTPWYNSIVGLNLKSRKARNTTLADKYKR